MTLIFHVQALLLLLINDYNVSEDVVSSKSLISLRNQPIENVRSFKYLGHGLCNDPSKSFAVKMNNRANFYENRFRRSIFSEKRRM